MIEHDSVITFLEQNKQTLPASEIRHYMNTLHRDIKIMPPQEWKRVEALQEFVRNKVNHLPPA